MRVRLINPFLADVSCIDYRGGELRGAFDDDFGDVNTKTVDGHRVVERPEKPPVRVRCQIEDETFAALRMFDAGNSPEAKLAIVVDMKWLARQHWVLRDGLPKFQVNDRLRAIYTFEGALVHTVRDPPGLYCVEARPISYGIGRRLDLLLLRFNDRAQSQNA